MAWPDTHIMVQPKIRFRGQNNTYLCFQLHDFKSLVFELCLTLDLGDPEGHQFLLQAGALSLCRRLG